MKKLVQRAGLLVLAAWLSACATAPQTTLLAEDMGDIQPPLLMIENTPFFPQEDYQCGPAALATSLAATGLDIKPSQLVSQIYVPDRRGSFQTELSAAARSHGRLVYEIDPTLTTIITEVQAGNLVIVLQNLGLDSFPRWHFAVVKGYDLLEMEFILNSGPYEDYRLSLSTFERTWERANYWAITAVKPGVVPMTANEARYFQSVVDLEHSYDNSADLKTAYTSGLDKWPESRELNMGLGNSLLSAGDYAQAIPYFEKAIAVDNAYGPAHNNLAHVLLQLGQAEQAYVHARAAVDADSQHQRVYAATLRETEKALNR